MSNPRYYYDKFTFGMTDVRIFAYVDNKDIWLELNPFIPLFNFIDFDAHLEKFVSKKNVIVPDAKYPGLNINTKFINLPGIYQLLDKSRNWALQSWITKNVFNYFKELDKNRKDNCATVVMNEETSDEEKKQTIIDKYIDVINKSFTLIKELTETIKKQNITMSTIKRESLSYSTFGLYYVGIENDNPEYHRYRAIQGKAYEYVDLAPINEELVFLHLVVDGVNFTNNITSLLNETFIKDNLLYTKLDPMVMKKVLKVFV